MSLMRLSASDLNQPQSWDQGDAPNRSFTDTAQQRLDGQVTFKMTCHDLVAVAVVMRLDEKHPEVRTLGLRRHREAANSTRARHGQLRSSSHLHSTSGDAIRCRRP